MRYTLSHKKYTINTVQQTTCPYISTELNTRSSAVAERLHDASCLSVVSFNIQCSFLLVVTAASDLLVHKILLNFVLLSPIVSGGVRPKLPNIIIPLFFAARGSVGVRTPPHGSDRVRSTG